MFAGGKFHFLLIYYFSYDLHFSLTQFSFHDALKISNKGISKRRRDSNESQIRREDSERAVESNAGDALNVWGPNKFTRASKATMATRKIVSVKNKSVDKLIRLKDDLFLLTFFNEKVYTIFDFNTNT